MIRKRTRLSWAEVIKMSAAAQAMDLKALLNLSSNKDSFYVKQGVSEERLRDSVDSLRYFISWAREYPDLFVDFCSGENGTFKFYDYQRVFLRAAMRHRFVYATYPRAYSKSFLGMLTLVLRAVLYPGVHLFVTTGGKLILYKFQKYFNKEEH